MKLTSWNEATAACPVRKSSLLLSTRSQLPDVRQVERFGRATHPLTPLWKIFRKAGPTRPNLRVSPFQGQRESMGDPAYQHVEPGYPGSNLRLVAHQRLIGIQVGGATCDATSRLKG